MSIWPIDDPYGGETGWPDRRELHPEEEADVDPLGQEFPEVVDDIERVASTRVTRADERLDEDDTDYDGPGWPF